MGVATILYAVSFTHLPQETAWRALFMVGILPALFVFFVRRYVEEPPIYLETRSKLEAVGVFAGIAYATIGDRRLPAAGNKRQSFSGGINAKNSV